MKINLRLFSALLSVMICICLAGCNKREKDTNDVSIQFISYSTGVDETGQYNNKLYGMNGDDIWGADPGCFYLSEEDDQEWGGYFYMYPTSFATNSGASLNSDYYKKNGISNLMALCYRSKDLYNWELCGALEGGFSCIIDEEDWCKDLFWAPEVVRNPADGKYYMYFSAASAQNWGVEYMSDSSNDYDRLYIGVAVSDTPVGPFDVLYDIDSATGKRVPTINFKKGCNTKYNWAVIDASPFFDDNGDFYLYFNKHTDDHYTHLNGVWGVKMFSMTQPDYSTVSCLTIAGKSTVTSVTGKIEEISPGDDYFTDESGINEGPFMIKHNGKYYITYSSNGFKNIAYSVHQAVSDSPLSGFVKLDAEKGNPVLNGSLFGYMNGTAHHSIVKRDDEMWIVYHRHDSAYGYDSSWGRSISSDRIIKSGSQTPSLQIQIRLSHHLN